MAALTPEQEFELKKGIFLKHLESKEDLRDWVFLFLGIDLPITNVSGKIEDPKQGVIYGSPGEAVWEAYQTYKNDLYISHPGYIWMANRDGGKTIAGSILNVLLIVHFKAEIAHLAAVKKQAEKCLEYTNTFVRKIKPFLEHIGRKVVTDSKHKIQILNEDNSVSFIDVIVASLSGANSQRSTVGSYDELDTLSKQGLVGYKEAQLIPTRKNNHGPMTVKYSTRKFAFGVFEKEIQNIDQTGERLMQWNILDITEKCSDKRSQKLSGNTHTRYVKKELPLKIYTEEDVEMVSELEKNEFRQVSLYDGCLKCPLASICQGKLSERPNNEVSRPNALFKSIDFSIGQFRKTTNEMAEAQLLCWKPTTIGLVYPRFGHSLGDNVVTLDQAHELITGDKSNNASMEDLIAAMHRAEAKIYAGVDFGYTHDSVIVVLAVLPSGYSLILDTFGQPGLEAHDFADIALTYQQKYTVDKWFCDQAAPANIKTFERKKMKCPDFKKDVLAGIDAIRGQIITTSGSRMLKVINRPENETILAMFKEHHFLLDNAGNVTKTPDDSMGIADRGDALRYIGQNVFSSRKGSKPAIASSDVHKALSVDPTKDRVEAARKINEDLMRKQITQRAKETETPNDDNTNKKKRMFWSM